MREVAKLQIEAAVDMLPGEKRRLATIASSHDRSKQFDILADVEQGVTDITVTIDRLPVMKTKANVSKKRGQTTKLLELLTPYDYSLRDLHALGQIKKGDALNVRIETL